MRNAIAHLQAALASTAPDERCGHLRNALRSATIAEELELARGLALSA
jgi:hypothetical protein